MIRKYRGNRVSESRSPRRRMMKESYGVYDLIDYFDVWGNEEDGWDVNNLAKVEEGIYIDDSLSDEEIVDYLIDEVGFFSPSARGKIEVDSSTGDFIEFFNADTYEPLGRLERTRTVDESYKGNRKRKMKEWVSTQGEYIPKEEIGKRAVLEEARRLGARLIKSTDSSLAYKLLDEGFQCICCSYDRYGNCSACVAGKNISSKGLPNDNEEYVYTNGSGAASAILSHS